MMGVPIELESASQVFEPTLDETQIRDSTRGFLARHMPSRGSDGQDAVELRAVRELSKRLASELGVYGVLVNEAQGGAGLSLVETVTILEEMGRVLYSGAFLSGAVMAVTAVHELGATASEESLLRSIADGELLASVAVFDVATAWRGGTNTVAVPCGDSWALDGTKTAVIDAIDADIMLVAAQTDSGVALFAVPADAEGLTVEALPTLDRTRPLATIRLAGSRARRIGSDESADAALRQVLTVASIGIAAEQIGAAQACLEASVEYAKQRYQFGKAIGSFQAIQHKCADMLLVLEGARSAVRYAAWAAETRSAELPAVASIAKACACDAAFTIAADTVQIHGGIGFTWSHASHWYLKRAKAAQLMFGKADEHYAELADHIGI